MNNQIQYLNVADGHLLDAFGHRQILQGNQVL